MALLPNLVLRSILPSTHSGNEEMMTDEAQKIVLIVDDEPLLRLSAMNVAQDAGFEAQTASAFDQAIRMIENTPEIRVVFTDIKMPGAQDGLDLAAAVGERWPNIGIVVTSGHLNPQNARLPAGCLFLSKPYSPDELRHALEQLA